MDCPLRCLCLALCLVVTIKTTSPQGASSATSATTTTAPSTAATTVVWSAADQGSSFSGENTQVLGDQPSGSQNTSLSEEPWMTSWRFDCQRPTTPCDSMYGMCDAMLGQCSCFNQAFGQQCQFPDSRQQNSGECLTKNPCTRGVCYDDGTAAKCSCPDGYYGDQCQHSMVHAECTHDKMVVNVFPYGFEPGLWGTTPLPVTAKGCLLQPMDEFVVRSSSYSSRTWQGFAREFVHVADPCAGDAVVQPSLAGDKTVYTREVHVRYDTLRHHTDTKVKLTCEVTSPDKPTNLPPPHVSVEFLDSVNGRSLWGSVRLGSTVVVRFSLNSPNSDRVDDLRLETCTVSDGVNPQNIVVLDHGCVEPPIGQSIQGGEVGTQFLTLTVHRFPKTDTLSFVCRVRLCDSLKDPCTQAQQCAGRRKRSASNKYKGYSDLVDVPFVWSH